MARSEGNHPFLRRQWLLLFVWPVAALAQADGGTLIDRTVAAVEGVAITLSQLEFESRVLLVNAGGVQAASAHLDQAVLSNSLQLIIDQRLATLEPDKLGTYPLDPGELERALAVFRDRLGGDGALRAFLVAQEREVDDVAQVLQRSMRAQRVLEGKLRLRAQVPEAEARREQAARPELKGLEIELVRQRLFVERFRALVQQELSRARKGADVRLLGPFAASAGRPQR